MFTFKTFTLKNLGVMAILGLLLVTCGQKTILEPEPKPKEEEPEPKPDPTADPAYLPEYGLPAWRDEFDYIDQKTEQPAIDPSKWGGIVDVPGMGPRIPGVKHYTWFGQTPDVGVIDQNQVYVASDGTLRIRGTWRDEPLVTTYGLEGNPTNRWMNCGYLDHRIGPTYSKVGDQPGTSSSKVVYSQHYGRWEIRYKTCNGPNSLGYHGGFWLRSDVPGEIDLTEFWGHKGNPPTDKGQVPGSTVLSFHSSTTAGAVNGKPYQKLLSRVHEELKDYSTNTWAYLSKNYPKRPSFENLHTYTFERMPTYFKAWFDGELYFHATKTNEGITGAVVAPWLWDTDFWGVHPSEVVALGKPATDGFHIRLNLHIALSEQYWGKPDPNNRAWTTDNQEMVVDYIRIWRYDPK